MTLRQLEAQFNAKTAEMSQMLTSGDNPDVPPEYRAKFDQLAAEAETLKARIADHKRLDDLERRAAGQPVGTGDRHLDGFAAGVSMLDAIRAGTGAIDAGAGRARELSAELERRSGRKAQGLLWHMGAVESRTVTTTTPAAGPGGNLIPTDFRPDLFIDRLRNRSRVRALGATMLMGLQGNLAIPRRRASVAAAWVLEDGAITAGDPQFDQVTMAPKHAGIVTEISRNMVQQASPDVEQLLRGDMALQLAEALDTAALSGPGTGAQPRGILNTAGIGAVAIGTNGGALTFDHVADVMGAVDDANGEGTGFLTNTRVRRAASKIKDSTGQPLGLATVFQGQRLEVSNNVPRNGTKGTGTNLSSLIYGAWADVMIGVWSELDILVNPYEGNAYARGNVQVRAMMTVDVAIRQPASFAAITDIVA